MIFDIYIYIFDILQRRQISGRNSGQTNDALRDTVELRTANAIGDAGDGVASYQIVKLAAADGRGRRTNLVNIYTNDM